METKKRNIKLVLQYDGTHYCGFQNQARDDRPTIQAVLERAIHETTGEQLTVTGSGRTDAGVHALGQVVNFVTTSRIAVGNIAAALNSRLPSDMAVTKATIVPAQFHSRYSARGKTYVYTWYAGPVRSPFWYRYAQFVPKPLHTEAMAEGACLFTGTHDFAAFSSAKRTVKTTVRHVYEAALCTDGPLVSFVVSGNGFLYHMVRIMAGTLWEIGLNKRQPASISKALHTRLRGDAGITAPAHGLTLQHVYYDDDGPEAMKRMAGNAGCAPYFAGKSVDTGRFTGVQ